MEGVKRSINLGLATCVLVKVSDPSITRTVSVRVAIEDGDAVRVMVVVIEVYFPLRVLTMDARVRLMNDEIFDVTLVGNLQVSRRYAIVMVTVRQVLANSFKRDTPIMGRVSNAFFVLLCGCVLLGLLATFPVPPTEVTFFVRVNGREVTKDCLPLTSRVFVARRFTLVDFASATPMLTTPLRFVVGGCFACFQGRHVVLVRRQFKVMRRLGTVAFVFRFLRFTLIGSAPASIRLVVGLPERQDVLKFKRILGVELFATGNSLKVLVLMMAMNRVIRGIACLRALCLAV